MNSRDLRGRQCLPGLSPVREREPQGLGVATRPRVTTPLVGEACPSHTAEEGLSEEKGSILIKGKTKKIKNKTKQKILIKGGV